MAISNISKLPFTKAILEVCFVGDEEAEELSQKKMKKGVQRKILWRTLKLFK